MPSCKQPVQGGGFFVREYARVSVHAVERFREEVTAVSRLTANLSECETTMTELYLLLDSLTEKCEKSLEGLGTALVCANGKKAEYDALVNDLSAEKSDIVSELDAIRADLSETPEYFTETDSDGKTFTVRNSEYDRLESQEDEAQSRLNAVNKKLSEATMKLERTKSVIYRLNSQITGVNNTHKQLSVCKDKCRKIQMTFAEVKDNTSRQTEEAYDILSRIIRICLNYTGQQIKNEALQPVGRREQVGTHAAESAVQLSGWARISNNPNEGFAGSDDKQYKNSTQKTDDNGQVYRVDNELVKNSEFQINGYTYKTDSNSRTIQASGKLKIPEKHDRMMEHMNIVGKGDQYSSDDRGHLIGHQFFGSDRLENLVPQEQRINQGSYARLESYLADLVNSGKDVYVCVSPLYKETRRPEAILYYYSVNGHSSAVFFPNELPEEIL